MKFYIHWALNYKLEPEAVLYPKDYSGLLDKVYGGEIEVDLPEPPVMSVFTECEVKKLRKEQGEFQHKIDQLEDRIQSFLCIEHKPEPL